MRRILSIVVVLSLVATAPLATGAEGAKDAGVGEKVTKARKMLATAKGMVVEGFNTLQRARSSGDTGRVQCVNAALTQMKGLLRLADNSMLELEESQAQGSKQGIERNAVKIKVATDKIADANRRLKSCMGVKEKGVTIGSGPQVLVQPDPDMPNVDPTEGLKDLAPALENTVSASPFFQ